jgi:signal transduction histidine kinase
MHDGQTQAPPDRVAGHARPKSIRNDLIVYADVGFALLPQRQIIYLAIAAITAFFYDVRIAVVCFLLVQLSEVMDLRLSRRILELRQKPRADLRHIFRMLYVNTVFSAGTISLFAIAIADQQGATTHFMPLFVLLAAALFAAMHNHQLPGVLAARLTVYSAAFLFIPIRDLWNFRPPLTSDLWLQMFVSLIVLFFTLDSARGHRKLYRQSMEHFDELVVEHERAKQALKAKAEFLAVVSHELRTPLTSIKGSIDLISSGVLGNVPETMAPAVDIALRNSTRLSNLINDILDYQKIDSDKMEYHPEPVEVRDLVTDATNSVRPMAEASAIRLEQKDATQSARINVDRMRIEQVLVNLLSNAIKFSEPGGRVAVTTRLTDDRVRISVSDEGVGLPDDAGQRIFEPFSQIDSSATRQAGGTGLGLSISKQIVDAHHGLIDFIQHEDKGTTFFVELNVTPQT